MCIEPQNCTMYFDYWSIGNCSVDFEGYCLLQSAVLGFVGYCFFSWCCHTILKVCVGASLSSVYYFDSWLCDIAKSQEFRINVMAEIKKYKSWEF